MPTKVTPELTERRRQRYEATADDIFICRTCGQERKGSEFWFDRSRSMARRVKRCKYCEEQRLKAMRKEARRERAAVPRAYRPHVTTLRDKQYSYARAAVRDAVYAGVLQKSKHCQVCGLVGKTEAHHPHGWRTVETILNVIWVCRACHLEIHEQTFIDSGKLGAARARELRLSP